MSDPSDPVEIEDVLVVKVSDRAMLIRTDDGTEAWIARSQLLDGTDVEEEGDVGTVVIPQWLADQKGLA